MKIGFRYNPIYGKLSEQAEEYGVSIKNVGKYEENLDRLFRLRFFLDIPDGEYDKLVLRFHKKLIKDIEDERNK